MHLWIYSSSTILIYTSTILTKHSIYTYCVLSCVDDLESLTGDAGTVKKSESNYLPFSRYRKSSTQYLKNIFYNVMTKHSILRYCVEKTMSFQILCFVMWMWAMTTQYLITFHPDSHDKTQYLKTLAHIHMTKHSIWKYNHYFAFCTRRRNEKFTDDYWDHLTYANLKI